MRSEHGESGGFLDVSDADLKKRLEEIRTILGQNDVGQMEETNLSIGEIRLLKSEAYGILCAMRDRGISTSPLMLDNPVILDFLHSLVHIRSLGEGWSLPSAVPAHSGR